MRSAVVVSVSILLAAFLAFHRVLPDPFGWLSVVECAIPWTGIIVLLLLVVAAFALRHRLTLAVVTVLVIVYGVLVLPVALPVSAVSSRSFTVASENINTSTEAGTIAAALATRAPNVIALQELDSAARGAVNDQLKDDYPYSFVVGTVGIWSRTALSARKPLDLGLGWERALSVDVSTPLGTTRLFVVHLASFRPGDHAERDTSLAELAVTLHSDNSTRAIVIGDFNTATDDHRLAPVLAEAGLVRTSTLGFPATWPAQLPVVALDHALTRGIPAATLEVLSANNSDHRPISLTIGSA
ncbi:hypothetical protein APU90_00665 [Rathayibacter toxicus]|uniref:Endonuclease/exonuclease/phosphatase domain-containing protein n=1 Tax=Rathayibacter toxicus TaxID=145458 RepID=A0A0C5BHA3_9MICO|nr:hypothetical protein TI83_05805 [Rathayibacter toxicus]ALS56487.1 hypothetical protein APU90_00665 [Rathayibacter toxicus]KKM44591.1 hypothetical protein VT73_08635 [Rathayibacter toxicus]